LAVAAQVEGRRKEGQLHAHCVPELYRSVLSKNKKKHIKSTKDKQN
jgi:hypothetical protein